MPALAYEAFNDQQKMWSASAIASVQVHIYVFRNNLSKMFALTIQKNTVRVWCS